MVENRADGTDRGSPYRAIAKVELRALIALKGAFGVTLLGNVLTLVVSMFVWRAVFRNTGEAMGFTFPEMRAYLLVAFASNILVAGNYQVAQRIIEGTVAVDLLRPIDYRRARLAEAIGGVPIELAAFGALATLAIALFGVPALPGDVGAWALFAASCAGALSLKFLLLYLTAVLCVWTTSFFGIDLARATLTMLLSGALVPLAFFPGWLEGLADVLPFSGIVNVPAEIYLGRLSGGGALRSIAVQLAWVVVLWAVGRRLWRLAMRSFVVHGG